MRRSDRGVALVAVLWILAVLAVMSIGYALAIRVNVELTANAHREVQALELARSGIEVTFERIKTARAAGQNITALADATMSYSSDELSLPLQYGTFSVRVVDEAGKLDVNTAEEQELLQVIGDEDLVAAILDWRGDSASTSLMGPQYYYDEGDPPYSARKGRFRSIGELALVSGVTAQLLWGEGKYLYTERQLGQVHGLADLLTVMSLDSNLAADGTARTNLNTATDEELQDRLFELIPDDAIQAILQYRQQNSSSGSATPGTNGPTIPGMPMPGDAAGPGGSGGAGGGPGSGGGVNGASSRRASSRGTVRGRQVDPGNGGTDGGGGIPGGGMVPGGTTPGGGGTTTSTSAFETTGSLVNVPGLADQDIQAIWDVVTADTNDVSEGRVNTNTAPAEVLTAVMGDQLYQEVARWRDTNGSFSTVADILSASPNAREVFETLSGKLTTRSYILTIESTGRTEQAGIVKRVRATVDVSGDRPNILWRSDY